MLPLTLMVSCKMTTLSCISFVLQVLTQAICVNVFTFDRERGKFKRSGVLLRYVRTLQYLLIMPLLIIFGVTTAIMTYRTLLRLTGEGLQASSTMSDIYALSMELLIDIKIGSTIYILFLLNYRLSKIQRILDAFVRTYQLYVQLFGGRVRLKWGRLSAMCLKVLLFDMSVGRIHGSSKLLFTPRVIYYAFSWQPLVLTWVACFAVTLLHALYRGVEQAMKDRQWRRSLTSQQIAAILQFFDSLMHLRLQLESYVQPLLAAELLLDVCSLTLTLHMYELNRKVSAVFAGGYMCLLHPISLANFSHDICQVQRTFGKDLLTFDDVHEVTLPMKQVEYFCLHKFILEKNEASSSGILHLRRGYILVFLDFAWTKSMFLNTVFVTSDERVSLKCIYGK